MKTLIHRMVPVADGGLATDVYLPAGPGPFPVMLVRTPYHRSGLQALAPRFVGRGYAFVTQDCRGKFDSDGSFTPLVFEAEDGLATLDWIANHSWCNGRIGMWGRSYLGIVQIPAAISGHQALRCIAPSVAPGSFFRDWLRYDGCFALGNALRWALENASCRNRSAVGHFTWDELNDLGGISEIAERVGFVTPCLDDWVSRDTYDDYWARLDQDHMYQQVGVPGLHAGGWFDHLTRTQYEAYRGITDSGASAAARDGQRLLIGPWGHQTMSTRGDSHIQYGDWNFGAAADFDVMDHELRFLDLHLRDVDDGISSESPVRVFLMGDNRWVDLDDWPVTAARSTPWFLDSGGAAHTAGDGVLRADGTGGGGEDGFSYDPRNPVTTRGGALYWGIENRGPVDLRPTMQRPDVLCYRSAPLAAPLTVIGDVELSLHLASDREDTDVVARLGVETSDGAVTCLTLGSLRCRFRHSWSAPEPLERHTPTLLRVQLGQTAYTFATGNRIVLTVTSSDFPRILPHPNHIAPLFEGDPVVARNRILHGAEFPSCLHLPIVEGI
jgi:putative CocE/NonD family hydrolase